MMSSNKTILHSTEGNFKCHAMMKIYPNGKKKIIAASKPIFGGNGWELSDKWDNEPKRKREEKETASPSDLMRAKRRATAKLQDYALCNDFKWFVTLTLSAEKIDRYKLSEAVKRLRVWLDNRVRRCGLKYLLVPEQHKDGAYHFHGFFNDSLDMIDSGTFKIDGCKAPRKPRSEKQRREWLESCAKPVYNIPDWQLGFSTAIEIYGDYNAAIGYVSKYVTKQGEKLGGRWYYSGGDLHTPDVVLLEDVDYYSVAEQDRAYCFELPQAGFAMAIWEFDDEGNDTELSRIGTEADGTDRPCPIGNEIAQRERSHNEDAGV